MLASLIKLLTKINTIVSVFIPISASIKAKRLDNLSILLSQELVSKMTLLPLIYFLLSWVKARVGYYINNWVYTTNHKRIAVNYFWFVIFSGICGTVLAVIIRLEMAYPGVGILAGDSLQYLSVVTAHAVIMVFFMIMPLLFGAFGNFLLPTQLGVHDVAFPRLNSVAFWFLPGGLIMLTQLICMDRRYQRMNCFNIREIQTLLRARFYADLIGENSANIFLPQTALGLRFKLNEPSFINLNYLILNRYGILNNSTERFQSYKIMSNEGGLWFLDKHYFNLKYQAESSLNPNSLFYNLLLFTKMNSFSAVNPASNLILVMYYYCSGALQLFFKNVANFTLTIFLFLDFNRPGWLILEIVSQMGPKFYAITKSLLSVNGSIYLEQTRALPYNLYNSLTLQQVSLMHPNTFLTTLFNGFTDFFKMSLNPFYSVLLANTATYYNLFSTLDLAKFLPIFFSPDIFYSTGLNWVVLSKLIPAKSATTNVTKDELYGTIPFENQSIFDKNTFNLQEQRSDYRHQRLQSPIFRYDFKLGNYMPDEKKKKSSFLYTTLHDITTGVRKPAWYNSPQFLNFIKTDLTPYLFYYNNLNSQKYFQKTFFKYITEADNSINLHDFFWINVSYSTTFYNYFYLLSDSSYFYNYRWLSINTLNQKFYKLYLTSSMQQRIHANWRQLKFSREAWRCKLLAARHQNTTYRRYLNEDFVVWAVERNAKDLLPGWAMITPFSARPRFTAVGKVDIGLFGVFLVINASIVASSNFLITYRYLATLNNRKMRDARSFFTEGVMVASWMIIAANPMLALAILMLLSDRHWQTSFFDYSGGGDTVMFQHMFWFFGHPEVYIILIPTFGFNNTILSFYLRKRVSARASLLYSMYTIAFLGFFVWGHHMYMVGLAHTTRMLFSTLTVMISVPAATKLMHWSVTLVNSTFTMELPFLFQLVFIFSFVSGGISGMAVAHTGLDILFHDSFYVVGHFHVMLAGAGMYGSWGAFYFYFPSIWGVKFSRIWGYIHFVYYVLGQFLIVVPMMWLGYSGMPRRVLDYPASMGGWHSITSAGTLLSVAGIMAFFIMLFDSLRQGRAVTRNTFGIPRYNTRLNFYLYVISRTSFLETKTWYLKRDSFSKTPSLTNSKSFTSPEQFELTLFSYTFLNK